MDDVVIRAEGLGKKYLISHQADRARYTALRDIIVQGARGLARSTADMLHGRPLSAGNEVEEFWALKEVSFEVKRGEVVGIIGRNGAGKSTLLKVLSRITEPSAGRVTIKGRVASLLEVGTGFHPELTGRENIYLNGAILGMTRAEIREKFDDIVAFAEVEKFLDTPVKRYSSGMYVRLAFAVAAHLEPEILLVDEVLAVGDAEFQRRCLGKMGEVASGGRTVLFVSHNMGAVRTLCASALLLSNGQVQAQGNVDTVVSRYSIDAKSVTPYTYLNSRPGVARRVYINHCHVHTRSRPDSSAITFHFTITAQNTSRVSINLFFRDAMGAPIGMAAIGRFGTEPLTFLHGQSILSLEMDGTHLAKGSYYLSAELLDPGGEQFEHITTFLQFDFEPATQAEHLLQSWAVGSISWPLVVKSHANSTAPKVDA